MVHMPHVDKLDALTCGRANDETITLTVCEARELVDEARGIEEDVITEWMDAVDPVAHL